MCIVSWVHCYMDADIHAWVSDSVRQLNLICIAVDWIAVVCLTYCCLVVGSKKDISFQTYTYNLQLDQVHTHSETTQFRHCRLCGFVNRSCLFGCYICPWLAYLSQTSIYFPNKFGSFVRARSKSETFHLRSAKRMLLTVKTQTAGDWECWPWTKKSCSCVLLFTTQAR